MYTSELRSISQEKLVEKLILVVQLVVRETMRNVHF